MKLAALAASLAFVCLSAGADDKKPVLRFGFTEACPHMCPNDTKQGFTTDIARTVFERLGYQVTFFVRPWSRAAADTASGDLHGVLSTGREEAPTLYFPQQEIAVQRDCFIGSSADPWRAGGATSFLGRRTIVFQGWARETEFREVLGADDYRRAFVDIAIDGQYLHRVVALLQRDRADAFWMDELVYAYYRKRYPALLDDSMRNLGCVHFQKLYLALSPAHPALSAQLGNEFDAGMAALRESGMLDSILAAYSLEDWRPRQASP